MRSTIVLAAGCGGDEQASAQLQAVRDDPIAAYTPPGWTIEGEPQAGVGGIAAIGDRRLDGGRSSGSRSSPTRASCARA